MKKYYPVCIDIQNRQCLVVGGGMVALRKTRGLLDCGAVVTVVSPVFHADFKKIDKSLPVNTIERTYRSEDLEDKFLVIGATDNQEVSRRISRDARSRNILCNIADVPESCSFILPAVVRRGDLAIAVSTSGKSPAFARHLRKQLEKQFGEEYKTFLLLMGALRQKLLAQNHAPEEHKPLFENLIEKGLLDMIHENDKKSINTLLRSVLGDGYDYDALLNTAYLQQNQAC
jgi:precorrin-2 dehydrogenase/sirohydrochlorin ferrochelatase